MERFITTLGTKNRQKLRQEFGFKSIRQAKKQLGVDSDAEAYEIMQDSYNQAIEEFRRQDKQQKNIFNVGYTLEQGMDKVEQHITSKNMTNFEITIKSATTPAKRKIKFKSKDHFVNWKNKLFQENEDSKGQIIDQGQGANVFNNITIQSIKKVQGGASVKHDMEKKITIHNYILNCFRPKTNRQDCLFTAIKYLKPDLEVDIKAIRKHFKIEGRAVKVESDIAFKILDYLEIDDIELFDDTEKEIVLDDKKTYIVLHNEHYYPVVNFVDKKVSDKKRRKLLAFDFETRPTEEYITIKATGEKMYILKDTIASVYYKTGYTKNQNDVFVKTIITTDNEKTSARKFIDFLIQSDKDHIHFNIIAHNGSNFDFYFILAEMTEDEYAECDINFRGTSVIGIEFRGHKFKDSRCFLANSLEKLSKNFQVEDGKITKFQLHGEEISSANLCFYKHELKFDDFMKLKNSDIEFWDKYEHYCMTDSIALYQIWKKFETLVNGMIEAISPFVLAKCSLNGSNTIGGHSKKILNEINKYRGQSTSVKRSMEVFLGHHNMIRTKKEMSELQELKIKKNRDLGIQWGLYKKQFEINTEKYRFVCNFKRGGISHCNQRGNHKSGVVGFDIKSQYPACLKYGMMPCGVSSWVEEYNEEYHGFYHFEKVYFDDDKHTYRPIAQCKKGESLNWNVAGHIVENQYIDSYMVKYLIKNNGLNLEKSVLTKGLVSKFEMPMDKLFGKYIDTFYNEKARQDELKEKKDPSYNQALRETIKLYLNSLTGKLVENPEHYFQLKSDWTELNSNKYSYTDDPNDKENNLGTLTINGVKKYKDYSDKTNEWVLAGVMVYSYSKRLLFEYVNMLPNKSSDIIHTETDGLYFSARLKQKFIDGCANYKGDYKEVMIGSELGNIEFDCESKEGTNNYFLGKKFYRMDYEGVQPKIKGFPQATIDDAGNKIQLVDEKVYEDHFKGVEVKKTFNTLKRNLTGDKPTILAYKMTRTLNINKEISEGKYPTFN